MIDGNWTKHPVAFCWYHQGALTQNMMHTHKCCERGCRRLDKNYKFEQITCVPPAPPHYNVDQGADALYILWGEIKCFSLTWKQKE